MNSPIRISLALAAALVVGTSLTACNRGGSGGGGGDTLASFDGEKIGKDDYYRYMERLPRVRVVANQGVVPAPVAGGTLGFQALSDMVRRQAILSVAKDEGVYPTDADIQKELDYQSSKSPDFLKRLTGDGLSIDTIKAELRIQLAQEKILTKGITLSDEEVDRYIKANPTKFREPKRVALRWLAAKTPEKKKQIDDALASGQSFADVAVRYSDDPNARATQARFQTDVYDNFSAPLKKLMDGTSEGRTTAWVQDPGGASLKFYVERKTPARNVDITPVIKETVKRELAVVRGQRGSDFERKVQAKILAAKVDIPNKPLADSWKQYIDSLKAADPTQAAANATASNASAGNAPTAGATASNP